MFAHSVHHRLVALAALALALGAATAFGRADRCATQERELPCEPDLDAAVKSAHGAFEIAVFRSAPRADAAIGVRARTLGAGIDPVRSVLAAERFAALVDRRGGNARIELSTQPVASEPSKERLEIWVATRESGFVLGLAGEAVSGILGAELLRVPFVEKAWMRGELDGRERFAIVLRSAGIGSAAPEALCAARSAAAEVVRERVPEAGALEHEALLRRVEGWELDRFETRDGAAGVASCTLLLGLSEVQVDALRAEAVRLRRAAIGGWTLRGAAGCLWLVLCGMLCARADLATRGYLTWTSRAIAALLFAAGGAAILTWL